MRLLSLTIVVASFSGCCRANDSKASPAPTASALPPPSIVPTEPPPSAKGTDLATMLAAYDKNEAAAQKEYGGRVIVTAGFVVAVTRFPLDGPAMLTVETLSGKELANVQCEIPPGEAAARATMMRKKDRVLLWGRVDRKPFFAVRLTECGFSVPP